MTNILTHLVDTNAAEAGKREAMYFRDGGEWKPIDWDETATLAATAAAALVRLGISPQQPLAIFSANRVEMLVTDFAAYLNRAIPVSLYSTSSLDQVIYILNDTRAADVCRRPQAISHRPQGDGDRHDAQTHRHAHPD